jgi:hypothetical protein
MRMRGEWGRVAVALAAVAGLGCQAKEFTQCADTATLGCGHVKQCCTTTDCHFEADGRTFDCNGLLCDNAAKDLQAYCAAAGDLPVDTGTDTATDTAPDAVLDVPPDAPKQPPCLAGLVKGLAFRFTGLDVQEPSEPIGLPDFLNNIWKPDIATSRLNIALRVEKVEEITVEGSRRWNITVTAGSTWHNLTIEDVLPVNAGDGGKTPSEYYFLGDLTSQFIVQMDETCHFESIGKAALRFHPGPMDHALICSGGFAEMDLRPDTIPLDALFARGRFNDAGDQIVDAYLEGCIAQKASCRICSFLLAPDYSTWARDPDTTKPDTPCTPDYCIHNCSRGAPFVPWANFGGFVGDLGVPLQCDFDGDADGSSELNGYKIAGAWTAAKVKFVDEPAK